ncbi:MAG: hypothetical protein NVS1B10_03030 [Candidatus Saccharimonadales bacterium]
MDIDLPKTGSYVIAVSGGVDSIVLLDLLQKSNNNGLLKLYVAHLDHGIRSDSKQDRLLVESIAKKYNVPFYYQEARLGKSVSEDKARQTRYAFLEKIRCQVGAEAILTAHHQDDVLETAVINILRGSGRKGLTSLSSSTEIIRPLLNNSKQQLLDYAKQHNLKWREDFSNQDIKYLRNYVRLNILSRFDVEAKKKLLKIIKDLKLVNNELDQLLSDQLNIQSGNPDIERYWFNLLPHNIAVEIMATWLRRNQVRDFDRNALNRIVISAKVASPGKIVEVKSGLNVVVGTVNLALNRLER